MSRALLIGWKRWTSFVVLLFVVLSGIDYFAGINSGAMSFARETLQGSRVLQQRVGSVRSVDLDWLWGFREKSTSSGTEATLFLSITGTTCGVCVRRRGAAADHRQWRGH